MQSPSSPQPSWPRHALAALLIIGGAQLAFARALPAPFTGQVVGVVDGDTVDVLVQKEMRRVRLWGVDTPEKKQDYGARAKQFTSSLVFGKVVTVEVKSNQKTYKRTVGIVRLADGRNLNYELVRNGYAWWADAYAPKELEFKRLEEEARRKKLNVWSRPDAVAPWVFRENQKIAGRAKRDKKAAALRGSPVERVPLKN